MSATETFEVMARSLNDILRAKGVEPVEVSPDMELLGEGFAIDSLDLAQIVIELQMESTKDPFANGFIEFRTVGDLCKLFAS